MRVTMWLAVLMVMWWMCGWAAAAPPAAPRIDFVDMLPEQPQQGDPATIWYDDFDTGDVRSRYYEYSDNKGDFVPVDYEKYGLRGRSLRARFQKGEVGAGGMKVFFGDNPAATAGKRHLLRRPGEHFREIYWRIYVKHQRGWEGSPAKLTRATILAGPNWSQAMIAHHWSAGPYLTLDPASGIKNNRLVTTKYNDFPNLRWLGNKPVGRYPIFSTEESGHWVAVECYVRLNSPGRRDGEFTAWIDGRLDSTRRNLDWVGTWDRYGLNAVFVENYWNRGSPKEQERYFDNFVISTKPIGPVVTPTNPTIVKTAFEDPDPGDRQAAWQVQVASDPEGRSTVWVSRTIEGEGNQVVVNSENGKFLGPAAGRDALPGGKLYWCRVRQQDSHGQWSPWSPWHCVFKTASE